MFSPALISFVLALQGAGQTPPQQAQQPATPPVSIPAVPTAIPPKYVAPAPGSGSAVAKVDGQPIYGHEVEALLWESLGPQAVEDVINLVIIRRAAAKDGLKVSLSDVEKRLKENIKMYDDRSKTDQRRPQGMPVEEFLLQQGYPLSRLYLSTEIEVTLDKMAEKTFKPDQFVKVSLMLFKADAATPAAAAVAQKNATDAVARMKAGTGKWETEVTKSQMPAEYISKAGLLGWLDQNTFPPDVMGKIKALQPGQISDPIKVDNAGGTSYQVFRLEQLGTKATGADLDGLKARYVQGQHAVLLNAIRNAAKVERFPTTEPAAQAATTGTTAATGNPPTKKP